MSGRPVHKQAKITELQKLLTTNKLTDNRPLVAFIMRNSGCTFTEIAEVFNLSRQQAETIYQSAMQRVENHDI